MARRREDQIQPLDKYSTNLFYGGQPEQQAPRQNNFGATYSNGQARPVAHLAPLAPAPARMTAVNDRFDVSTARNDNWRQDEVAFSAETRELQAPSNPVNGNGSNISFTQRAGRGNASGPAYSDDFRRVLDALLNGTPAAV